MRIEMNAGAVSLGPDQTLKLVDSAGATVCALNGSVWITEQDERRDIVLQPGACYRLKKHGIAIINSLGGQAAVSLA